MSLNEQLITFLRKVVCYTALACKPCLETKYAFSSRCTEDCFHRCLVLLNGIGSNMFQQCAPFSISARNLCNVNHSTWNVLCLMLCFTLFSNIKKRNTSEKVLYRQLSLILCTCRSDIVNQNISNCLFHAVEDLRLGVPRQGWKGDPLMTSSCSVNRDKTFWSNLGRRYAGHPRKRSWDYTSWLAYQKMQKGIHYAQF